MKINMKKDKKAFNKYKVTMEVTEGVILSVKNALERYKSPVAQDVLDFWVAAAQEAGMTIGYSPDPAEKGTNNESNP